MKILLIIMTFLTALFSTEIALLKVASTPAKAIYLTQPKHDNERLFILNQKGKIFILKNGNTLKQPFLNITDRVHGSLTPGSEEGLLGLAFHPDYENNGFFYVNYVNKKDSSIVARFTVTSNPELADPSSEKVILKLLQPFGNHNGGHLIFGPKDNMLYIGFGDGGKSGDPYNNSQNLNTFLGAILRIDVDNGDPYSIPLDNPFYNQKDKKSEIFCYGLRNPWRFSFDRENNDLLIGDVGQNKWEEVNWNTWDDAKGANFGWRIMEADHCYNPEDFCDTTGLKMPIHEYPNNAAYMRILMGMDEAEATGCSVTGGYVYRGNKNSSLWGTYIFGDYCTGRIWAFKNQNGKIINFQNIRKKIKENSKDLPLFISSFGEDNSGELYVVDYLGAIYKFIINN
jgi:hypothetical protein